MQFAFTEEQEMIRDTAADFLAEVSTSAAIREVMATEQGYDAGLWQRVCGELCWPAIHTPEQYGGMGLGQVELAAMQEQMGRYLFCSPFFATVGLGVNALLVAGTEAQRTKYLPLICEGMTATLAYSGRSRESWGSLSASAIRQGEQYRLNGTLRYVIDGATAQLLIIAARSEAGISLFAVPANTTGIERTLLPSMDQTRKQAEIRLNDVAVPVTTLMGEDGQAEPLLEKILNLAAIALAAEQLGGAQQTLDMAVAYSKERTQFDRPIAAFQAIKHMAADMMLRCEAARSAVYYAACIAEEDSSELAEAASIAKAYCSDAFFKNAAEALQIHGGVGFTWEYDVHLYFKRAKASEHMLGNSAWHRERLAQKVLL